MTGHLERLNPAQQTTATAAAPVLAGAGSGKTETLIWRKALQNRLA